MALNTPRLIALRPTDEPEVFEGTTEPVRMICALATDLSQEEKYIVKFGNNLTLNLVGLASEIVVGHLAKHFRVPVPDFGLVEITPELQQAAYSNLSTPANVLTAYNQNTGTLNFGSKIIGPDLILPLASQNYSSDQAALAERIFAFDALIYNGDRTIESPNLYDYKGAFVVFDHERAFNFLADGQFEAPLDLDFRFAGGGFMQHHFFRPFLRKQDPRPDFSEFIDELEALDDGKIAEAIEQVPNSITTTHQAEIEAIEEHLRNARENSRIFGFNLMRTLA